MNDIHMYYYTEQDSLAQPLEALLTHRHLPFCLPCPRNPTHSKAGTTATL